MTDHFDPHFDLHGRHGANWRWRLFVQYERSSCHCHVTRRRRRRGCNNGAIGNQSVFCHGKRAVQRSSGYMCRCVSVWIPRIPQHLAVNNLPILWTLKVFRGQDHTTQESNWCCPLYSGVDNFGKARIAWWRRQRGENTCGGATKRHEISRTSLPINTEDIRYYDYRPVTLLLACFISFQRYALS